MKEKVQLTAEQLYKKNQFKSRIFKTLGPVVFYSLFSLFVLFISLTISNSWGNITEIINLLDKDTHTGEQIAENYKYLVEKWGEWSIVFQEGSAFNIRFIDIKSAFFSGLMITYMILAVVSLCLCIILGKVLFPKLAQYFSENNQDMVNMATLQTNAEIQRKKNKKEEEWF